MTAQMTKRERVFAALRGEEVDSVPVSAWWHDFAREWSAEGLADATLDAYREYGWDFIKVNPRATYYAEDWGSRFQPREGRQPEMLAPAVASAADVRRIQPLDATQGAYGQQLAALRLIAGRLRGEAPFVQTVFSPLAVMTRLTGATANVQGILRDNPRELLGALEAVAGTLAAYARECLSAGAAGIFFATVEWGAAANISAEEYDTFARPFDLQVLDAVRDAPFNVLHVCRAGNHLLRLLDYPVAAFHWDNRAPGNPSLKEVSSRTAVALMGGVSHDRTLGSAPPEQVFAEARAAIAETAGRRFLLAPNCSVEPAVPPANLRALVEAARP
jgi:uroporphyrinogen decarboxylase